jgi:hypothetical protein
MGISNYTIYVIILYKKLPIIFIQFACFTTSGKFLHFYFMTYQ